MNIKVISNEIIRPSCPTPKALQSLRASLLDRVNSPTLMPLIFFFDSHNTTCTKRSTNDALARLKESLPNTLTVFYPLAGRIQDTSHFNCNDKGVPYVQAVVDKKLKDVVQKAEVSQLDKLLPPYGQEGFTSLLLAIQINVFSCGGIAIGVKMNHAISDAFSFFSFFNTWAYMANSNHILRTFPSFDISKLFPTTTAKNMHDIDVYANHNTDLIKNRPVTKWFAFEEAKLNGLRENLLSYTNSRTSSSNNDCSYKVSPTSLGMILSAFIWNRVKVACRDGANDIPHQAFQAVNIRPRLSLLNEKSYYFGNVFVNAVAKLPIAHTDSNYSNESIMGDFKKEMKKSITRISNDMFIKDLKEGKEDLRFVMNHFERETRGEIVSLGFSNLLSMPVYEADFGWGKPTWVTTATLMYNNVIILLPASGSSKDIVAYINLIPEDMIKLESDREFTTLVSKVYHVHSKL